MVTILCVLYPDPTEVLRPIHRRHLPTIKTYPDGQKVPNPHSIDFTPGNLLGSVSGELGLRPYLTKLGHNFIVTAEKDGALFEEYLREAEIVISQPFWPAYLSFERIKAAPNLKLIITAGVGSDHVDLRAASERSITVAEVTFSNSISVAEHTVMLILAMLRNYLRAHELSKSGGWNIADCALQSFDLEKMEVGIFGAGRIGMAVMKRLASFDAKLHYSDWRRLPAEVEASLELNYHRNLESLAPNVDILSLHAPLHPSTEGRIGENLINTMRPGSYIVNTARARLCEPDAIVAALESGQLAGYAGDVWYPQPPSPSHPWRNMPNNGMTPHISGTTLSAQARYAAGVREILECWFEKRQIRPEYVITEGGKLAGTGSRSYSLSNV